MLKHFLFFLVPTTIPRNSMDAFLQSWTRWRHLHRVRRWGRLSDFMDFVCNAKHRRFVRWLWYVAGNLFQLAATVEQSPDNVAALHARWVARHNLRPRALPVDGRLPTPELASSEIVATLQDAVVCKGSQSVSKPALLQEWMRSFVASIVD